MPGENDSWTGNWIADRIQDDPAVAGVEVPKPNLVQINRKNHSPVRVATTSVIRFDGAWFSSLLDKVGEKVSFVVNIPPEGYVLGDALRLSKTNNAPIGGIGDLKKAIVLDDVAGYVNKNIQFIERGLRQHTHVRGFEQLADRLYRVNRGDLPKVDVVFLNEYELTADDIRIAKDRYGEFSAVVITNPAGTATSAAINVGRLIGCRVYDWRDFYGKLRNKFV